jgi:mercuric ion transport protein
MRRIGGILLTVTGFLACPCHLIITLPLLASLLAGTALGSFLTRNTGLVFTFAGIYFIVALVLGFWLLVGPSRRASQMKVACPTCVAIEPDELLQEQSSIQEELSAPRR